MFMHSGAATRVLLVLSSGLAQAQGTYHELDWTHHVCTICSRARASLETLQVLGNTHRELSKASSQLLSHLIDLYIGAATV